MSLLPDEIAARNSARSLAREILEMDFCNPEDFERAITISSEIEHAAVIAVAARRNAETPIPLMSRTLDESVWAGLLRSSAS